MLGIRYAKTSPTTYVLHYQGGRLRREGAGRSFLYFAPTSTLVQVPLESADLPFVFNEVASDFQEVTIQGQLSYRVKDHKRLAGLLDFSVDARGGYISDDPELLKTRLVQTVQVLTRAVVQKKPLRQVLVGLDEIVAEVRRGLLSDEQVEMLGVEVLGVSLLSIKPAPEMAKALEAEARERLKVEADNAIYERRNAAVEKERMIKENELNTEIAVEAKRRAIRENQMAADIAVEEARAALVERQAANDKKLAESKAYMLEETLKPLRGFDWRTLMAVGAGGGDPRLMIATAFRELAENAQKIGELNMTPDLLNSLLKEGGGER
ncbi:MAG: SPFH domain-containing protein [Elusimicrobia bacterium]|nr:SPFH domain-containing protein [Elusimicrobiota bacterium]